MDLPALADRIFAEAVAADFRDPAAFLEVRTQSVPDDVETWARLRSAAHQTDLKLTAAAADIAFNMAFDRLTGAKLSGPLPVFERTSRLGEALLEFDGRDLVLRVDDREPGREILRWRFISLLMPGSILAAAAAARIGRASPPPRIRLLHASMAPDGPVAQQHLHQSASVTFDRLWASLRVRTILKPHELEASLRLERAYCPGLHKGKCPRCMDPASASDPMHEAAKAKHMEVWLGQLHRAFLSVELLRQHAIHTGPLDECDDCRGLCRRLNNLLSEGQKGPAVGAYPWPKQARRLAIDARRDDARRRTPTPQHPSAQRDFLDTVAQTESTTVTAAFRHLNTRNPDPAYEALLLQYLRVKTATYRMLVHSPGRHGLAKFLHHFTQIETYQPSKTSVGVQAAQAPELDLRSTEYRVSPKDWIDAEQDRERAPRRRLGQSGADPRVQDAVLIHFQRSQPKGALPLYGASRRKLDDLERRVGNLLQQDPRRLIDLRGVDICGVEEHQPLWVSAQTLRQVREASSDVAARTSPKGLASRANRQVPGTPRMKIEPLRVTMHTGEDFSWLTTGVRTVAEPFRWGIIRRGDRIGHGLAVTLDPKDWWHRREGDVIHVSDFDRLQDLGFLASFTTSADGSPTKVKSLRRPRECHGAGVRSDDEEKWLQDQAESVLSRLDAAPGAGEDPVVTAMDLWTAIGQPVMRRLQSAKTPLADDQAPHRKLLHRYIWSRGLQRRSNTPRPVRVLASEPHELALLIKARSTVIRHLARWQIPIESNPSSNLVVGSLDAVASQTFLARSSQEARKSGLETLAWTISTDDPVTFATSLADEYAYAWAGMVLRSDNPYDPAHARALLEEAAATSMRTRFAARPA